jgi:hypothetical protein
MALKESRVDGLLAVSDLERAKDPDGNTLALTEASG